MHCGVSCSSGIQYFNYAEECVNTVTQWFEQAEQMLMEKALQKKEGQNG